MVQTPGDATLVGAYIALQMACTMAFLVIVLTAAFSSRVIRHPTWFSFCLSWALWGVSFSLLFYAGQQTHLTSRTLCIIQSALAYTMPFLTGLTSTALVIYVLFTVRSALTAQTAKKRHWVMPSLVCVPWFLGIIVFIPLLVYMIKHPNDVQLSHNGTFCVVVDSYIPRMTAAIATALSIMIVVIEALVGVLLYRHKSIIEGFPQSASLALQLMLFTAVVLCGAVLGLVFVSTSTRGPAFDIILGVIPLSASVIFGSQRDILLTWMFWRPRSTASDSFSQPNVSSLAELSYVESVVVIGQRG